MDMDHGCGIIQAKLYKHIFFPLEKYEMVSSNTHSLYQLNQMSSSDKINAGDILVAINVFRSQKHNLMSLKGKFPAGILQLRHFFSSHGVSLNIEMETIDRFLDDIMKEKPKRFTPQHLMSFTHNYANKLGSGGFGVVYKGQFPNGLQVAAVKVLHGTLDKRAEEQFMAEIGTIGRTYHINLVRLCGFCLDPMVKALVYEYT
ncbi:hypothetical protein COCNU_01G003670 [Cocos nucifera]|uniref:Protein kinase domain-containing protein n=1 Tax=Cocos nucifera TaxID=13894 RepID=A0A8K0HUJ7_COCNU|nr:hypothetical protein COCNU_01G003670 [Cocos nucifera]